MRFISYIFVGALFVFFLNGCEEKIIKDELGDIEITIHGFIIQEGVLEKASFGEFQLFLPEDTLNGTLDGDGVWSGVIENSSEGLAEVRLRMFYNGQGNDIDVYYPMLCCSTDLFDTISIAEEKEPDLIECESIERVENITITTSHRNCVTVGEDPISNNVYALDMGSDMLVSWDPDIFASMEKNIWVERDLGSVNNSGNEILVESGTTFRIYFDVRREEFMSEKFEEEFLFDVVCINDNGTEGESGTIQINVEYELCDPTICDCPVSGDAVLSEDIRNRPVPVGDNKLIEISLTSISRNLNDDCIFTITEPPRAEVSGGSWSFDAGDFPFEITSTNNSVLYADFIPDEAIDYLETFSLKGVMSSIEEGDEQDSCFFTIELSGTGCENQPPTVRALSSDLKVFPAMFIDEDFNEDAPEDAKTESMIFGKEYDLRDDYIYQAMNVTSNSCNMLELLTRSVSEFEFMVSENTRNCSSYDYSLVELESNEAGGEINAVMISNHLVVTGLSSDNEGAYSFKKLVVNVKSSNGSILFSQPFFIELNVTKVPFFDSGLLPIISFSEIDNPLNSSFNLFNVNLYNEGEAATFGAVDGKNFDGMYGFDDNGNYTEPVVAPYNMYVQQDEHDDRGNVELYLVNNTENEFSKVAFVEGGFNEIDDFNDHYIKGGFDNYLTEFINQNGTNATSFSPIEYPDGLDINEGDVYILFGDNSVVIDGEVLCKAALLYVYKVDEGDKAPGMDFVLKYPIGVIKDQFKSAMYDNF